MSQNIIAIRDRIDRQYDYFQITWLDKKTKQKY